MMRIRIGALLLVATLAPGAVAEEEQDPGIAPAILRTLQKRGFAVDGGVSVELSSTYRHSGDDPVYVSADAGIAIYLLLLRQTLDEAIYVGDADFRKDAASWAAAVSVLCPGERGRPARFVADVFAALARGEESSVSADLREAVGVQLARILGKTPSSRRAELLGTDLDEAALGALGRKSLSPEHARHDRAVGWITRVRLPSTPEGIAARSALVQTIPPSLRHRIVRLFGRAGMDRIGFPGTSGVFDVSIQGDGRFPPGTLPTRAELVGLDRGRSLGSRFAMARLAEDPFAKGIRPDQEPTRPGTIGDGFDGLLARLARPMDSWAPALFRSPEWEALSLQSALAADALFRREMGPTAQPPRVFGSKGIAGFVHPDAEFWRSLSVISAELAAELEPVERGFSVPPRQRILSAKERLRKCVAEWTSLPEEDLWVLRRCRPDGYWMACVEEVGSAEVPAAERPDCGKRVLDRADACLDDVQNRVESGGTGAEVHPSIARRRPAGMFRRLAEVSSAFAGVAEAQRKGVAATGLDTALGDFGFLCEDAEGFSGRTNVHSGCVVVLGEGTRRLVHGSTGLHNLWLNYPWKEGTVRARGVVFGYREWVGDEWPTDEQWRNISVTTSPPSWAAGALAPVPAEWK